MNELAALACFNQVLRSPCSHHTCRDFPTHKVHQCGRFKSSAQHVQKGPGVALLHPMQTAVANPHHKQPRGSKDPFLYSPGLLLAAAHVMVWPSTEGAIGNASCAFFLNEMPLTCLLRSDCQTNSQ